MGLNVSPHSKRKVHEKEDGKKNLNEISVNTDTTVDSIDDEQQSDIEIGDKGKKKDKLPPKKWNYKEENTIKKSPTSPSSVMVTQAMSIYKKLDQQVVQEVLESE